MRLVILLLSVGVFLPAAASLPRLGLLPLDVSEEYDSRLLMMRLQQELSESGRFDAVNLFDDSTSELTPENLPYKLEEIASESSLDVLMLLEARKPTVRERTRYTGDSLRTTEEHTVELSGRFYSSTGRLIGSISDRVTREVSFPTRPDLQAMSLTAADRLVSKALIQLFPVEISFSTEEGSLVRLPEGSSAGIRKGMVMSVVATAERLPTREEDYQLLRSRGLVQITDVSTASSAGRLLSGELVPGGPVTAVETAAPAMVTVSYQASPCSVEPGEAEEAGDSGSLLVSRLRLHGRTCRWGLGFGGALNASAADNLSAIGVEVYAGPRIPLRSPQLALRLNGGLGVAFLMQRTEGDDVSTDGSAFTFGGVADVALEYLFSMHLGMEASVVGRLYTTADTWTVQNVYGETRDARPSELYYTEFNEAPVSGSLGLFYLIY
ncbi:hypothetical protein GF402_04735 [Candidatus Fermentibacteria bacterium]|nr:hypothetical protein [Candidatus Fermentibacteria bacterium]